MQIFYAPDVSTNIYFLDEKESHHCIRVLRMPKGSEVKLIDGRGNLYEGYIENPDHRKCRIEITNIIPGYEKRPYHLHIAISPLKNSERFEWFVEKSVEIGIDEITPLICRNTEKKNIKAGRLNNLIISAMKQSLKASLTILNNPMSCNEFICAARNGKKMIAHCSPDFARETIGVLYSGGDDAVIMIGPEGDFSTEEINTAIGQGYKSIHMGTSRLRTETAGIAACHSIYFINQQA